MHSSDRITRSIALSHVEHELRAANLDFDLRLIAQAHYGQPGFAFIEVHGVDDQITRRRLRKEAGERLEEWGFPIELIEAKDIFHIEPTPPDD